MVMRRNALGRGLDALLPSATPVRREAEAPARAAGELALDEIAANPDQPRRRFDDAEERVSSLEDLDGVLSVARNLVGHSWYLLVATLGVVLVLLVVDGRRLASRVASRTADTSEVVLTVRGVGYKAGPP